MFSRNDILENFDKERKKAIDYMTMNQSRVAITTDMWTAGSQKKGYMAVTAHFIDDSWKLRSIIMGYYNVLLLNLSCRFLCVVASNYMLIATGLYMFQLHIQLM